MTTAPARPDLTAVIKWLENGCDPHEAVEARKAEKKARKLKGKP